MKANGGFITKESLNFANDGNWKIGVSTMQFINLGHELE